MREWVENEIEPHVTEWDEAKTVPDEIYKAMGQRGYLAGLLGVHYPTEYGNPVNKTVKPEDWDLFHELLSWCLPPAVPPRLLTAISHR